MHILKLTGNGSNITASANTCVPVANVAVAKDKFGISLGSGVFKILADGEYTATIRVAATPGSSTIGVYRGDGTNCYGHVIGLNGNITFDALKDQELFVGFVSYETGGATIYPDAFGTCIDLSVESV